MPQYVMCKYNNNVLLIMLITSFYYSPHHGQYAGSNSYRESFFEAMDDVQDIPQ